MLINTKAYRMAKYVLRPEQILPQVSLIDALLWIAFNTYPESFWDISSHDVDTNPLINHLNVEPDFKAL